MKIENPREPHLGGVNDTRASRTRRAPATRGLAAPSAGTQRVSLHGYATLSRSAVEDNDLLQVRAG